MKRSFSRLGILFLALSLVFSLSACGGGGKLSTKDASTCVQVEMDATYKGQFDGYLDFYSNVDRSDAVAQHNANLEAEAEYFLNLYGLPQAEDDTSTIPAGDLLAKRARDLFADIYAKASYEILSSTEQDDGTFAVKVSVEPIDIIHLVDADFEDAFAPFWEKFENVDTASMTEEEYIEWYEGAFADAYYEALLDLLEDEIPNIGYLEEKSIVVQVQQDEDQSLFISQEDSSNLDWLVIDYASEIE